MGSRIWPPWLWPARTRSTPAEAARGNWSGEWLRTIRKSASAHRRVVDRRAPGGRGPAQGEGSAVDLEASHRPSRSSNPARRRARRARPGRSRWSWLPRIANWPSRPRSREDRLDPVHRGRVVEQVAGEGDEVGVPPGGLVGDDLEELAAVAVREVEVGDLDQGQAVERRGSPGRTRSHSTLLTWSDRLPGQAEQPPCARRRRPGRFPARPPGRAPRPGSRPRAGGRRQARIRVDDRQARQRDPRGRAPRRLWGPAARRATTLRDQERQARRGSPAGRPG